MRYNSGFVYKFGAIWVLIATVLYLIVPDIAKWLMVVGVAALLLSTAFTPYPGKSVRGKRLYNFQIISCMLMAVSAYLMFTNNNIWALTMMVGAVFLFYAAIMIPKELEKDKLGKNNT